MNNDEKLLIETFKNILEMSPLNEDVKKPNENDHNVQFQWEEINDKFALEVKDSDYFVPLTSSFRKIHSIKWLSDTHFGAMIRNELKSQGIPQKDIDIAVEAVEKLSKAYREEDSGFPTNLDKIKNSMENPDDKPPTKTSKETFSGENEPFTGIEPKNTRPVKNEA
ncbi:MAG: hypothetical protein M0P71_13750 [Melioribacteraceae bacterium]|nr:hypothetical protein [Melioribacteraceae bacterium]